MTNEDFIKKRNYLLINFENMDDVELLVKLIGIYGCNIPSNPEVARIALHKARVNCTDVPKELKTKSIKWLKKRGYSCNIYSKKVNK